MSFRRLIEFILHFLWFGIPSALRGAYSLIKKYLKNYMPKIFSTLYFRPFRAPPLHLIG